jgi:23S rRNA-/tRNA-specific pseudouridylate synthase
MNILPYKIYENDEYILLYKPPGWSCNTKLSIKRMYKNNKFIVYFIKFILKNNFFIEKFPYGLMNRLDNETSGCVIVVKNKIGFDKMLNIIHINKKISKIYLCLVNNKCIKKKFFINSSIICDKKIKEKRLDIHCDTTNNKNVKYYAKSFFYKIKNLVDSYNNNYTLFYVKIFTGKTHQIRVHINSIGYPIVSDPQYLDKNIYNKNIDLIPRCFLHNIYYQFTYDDIVKKFIIPIPDDIISCLHKLNYDNIDKIHKIPKKIILMEDE